MIEKRPLEIRICSDLCKSRKLFHVITEFICGYCLDQLHQLGEALNYRLLTFNISVALLRLEFSNFGRLFRPRHG
ncbi:hypothetical protein A6R73_12965 [Xanthomonas translucens pv. poae]|uniref:Uncharacterized protein n=1 Tax=Xanthomonas graminis pv. poae TaxID=227946 RepID=A0A199P726_9XANT|nr:hypothetical protein A6R73_12965 [Xanthomonas translucens pv. poae]